MTTFLNGLWKGEKPPYATVGVIRNTNFGKDGSIDDSDIAWLEVEVRKFEKRKLKFGDIILEKSGGGPKQPVGRVALFEKEEGDYSFSNFTSAIRVNDAKDLDYRYLHKFLFWKYASGVTEGMQSHSTGIRNLNADAYKDIAVPLPPLPEQQRIVAILDEAFAGLATATANAEKNLKNTHELFDNYLSSVFTQKSEGWRTSELGKEVKFIDYRGKTPPKKESGIRLITAKNVKMNRIQREPEEFIDADVYDGWMTRGYPKKGDVLFTTEAPLGNVAQLDTDETVVIGQRLITMQPYERVLDRTFLKYVLMSRPTQGEIFRRCTGATVVGIKASLLKLVPIIFPPKLSDQQALAKEMESNAGSVTQLEENYRRKIKELAALKQSLLHKAFSGELTSPPSQAIKEAAE
jgi:type I restriction enzyme, S subunit